MRRGLFILCFLLGSIFLIYIHAMAQNDQGGKIRIGNLKIIPGLALEEVYDDNIFLGNGDNNNIEREEDDWITHVKPSLLFDYTLTERGFIRLGYSGDYAFYAENDDNDWQNHNLLLMFNYKSPGGLILGIKNIYSDLEDPFGNFNDYNLGVPKTRRWTDDLKTKAGYAFSDRLQVLGYYNFYKQSYDNELRDYTQDYDNNEIGAGFQVKLMPKTWGFIRYHYGEKDYYTHPAGTGSNENNDADFNWHRVNLGLLWDPKAKLKGELNFGYQWMGYDNARDINGDLYRDKDTWIASTKVSYKATETTILKLEILRSLQLTGSVSREYYEDTSIGVNLRQVFWRKFTLAAGFKYSNYNYNLPVVNPREDDNYYADIGLNYQIQKWLKAGIGYAYKEKDSNIRSNEYTDNQFIFSLSAVY